MPDVSGMDKRKPQAQAMVGVELINQPKAMKMVNQFRVPFASASATLFLRLSPQISCDVGYAPYSLHSDNNTCPTYSPAADCVDCPFDSTYRMCGTTHY